VGDANESEGNRDEVLLGWYVVLGAFLILAINYGARYSFGVFVNRWPPSTTGRGR